MRFWRRRKVSISAVEKTNPSSAGLYGAGLYGAGEALALCADAGESSHVFTKCHGHREGGFGLRMVDADAIFHFGDAEREEIGLDGGGTVHAPGSVDERLDELGFGGV